jgi:beta-phosphoglucomutase
MIDTIILDLDGLLSDTETLHMKAYAATFRKHSVILTEEEYSEHWIKKGQGVLQYLKEKKLTLDPDEIRKEKIAVYHYLLDTALAEMPGASDLLESVYGSYKLGLATSSYRIDAMKVIRLLGFGKYFETIVTGNDVANAKPSPELFERAAFMLRAETDRCLVVEDAEKGIIAASRAGMKSVAIPNRYTKNNDFSLATYTCGSLGELKELLPKIGVFR